jgi:hypothetical protein
MMDRDCREYIRLVNRGIRAGLSKSRARAEAKATIRARRPVDPAGCD